MVLAPNDDAAEKKKRRQSLVDDRKRRKSAVVAAASPMKGQVSTVDVAPLPVFQHLSEDELNGMYNEWMKIAADNKINASNTWNVALIDYFHDLSLMKEGESINFQKASVTLDGCIKVYSSRIDSVSTETNKLLTGLATAAVDDRDKNGGMDNSENGDATDDGKQPAKKRSGRSVATLETNPEALKFKTLDCNLHLTVDPLFKKTSAEFDEGGATGLLLNKLSSGSDGRLIFSSNDSATSQSAEKEMPETMADTKPRVNVAPLKERFFPLLRSIWTRELCKTFKDYSFNDGAETAEVIPTTTESIHEIPCDSGADDDGAFASDFDDDVTPNTQAIAHDEIDHQGDYDKWPDDEPNHTEPDTLPAKLKTLAFDQRLASGEYAHLDTALMKNWAGPEHWRLRRFAAAAKPAPGTDNAKDTVALAKKRREKKSFRVDFLSQDDTGSKKSIFGPKGGATIRMVEAKGAKPTYLLPNDLHFSSKNLTRLFTKPLWAIKLRKPTPGHKAITDISADDMEGGAFWSEATLMGAVPFGGQDHSEQTDHNHLDMTMGTANATFLDDDGDDDDFDGGDGGQALGPMGDLDSMDLVARPKTIRKIQIDFAKSAKRVDVKKLKDNLWKQLSTQKPADDEGKAPKTNGVQGTVKFTEVIQTLPQLYPPNKARDISVPFCFICLLHLANEKGLAIEGQSTLSELTITQDLNALSLSDNEGHDGDESL